MGIACSDAAIGVAIVWGAIATPMWSLAEYVLDRPYGVGSSSSIVSCDAWDEIIDSLNAVCMLLGCSLEHGFMLGVGKPVEDEGWTVVMTYAAHGVRSDLSDVEKEKGAMAAENLAAQIASNPSVVSDELRPLLIGAATSIASEVRP